MLNIIFSSNNTYGYILVVSIIIILCLACWFIRKHFKIGALTKEEEDSMKSSLDLLISEEDIEEGKDYHDEV